METELSERQLWQKLRRSDAGAFEAFYRQHAPRLRSFLRHYLGNRQVAEDVAQETFLMLWQQPNGFEPGRGRLKAYLFGIARKRAAEWWRKRGPAEGEPQQAPLTMDSEPALLLEDALAHLEPELRGLLWLREVEGYSYAELAEILDIPLGTVKSRLFAAREELRRIWRGGDRET